MEDGSGWQKFSYGPLGEITENIRTFVLYCNYPSYTFKTQYRYDTWNRLKSLTYPDGEIVTYTYDRGGNLKTMTGEKMGDTYIYIANIHYNKFEKKVVIEYGNGVITSYDYDDELQRLERLISKNSQGDQIQDIRYEYDDVNNILSIMNKGDFLNSLVGESINTYTYDSLYRLIYSTNYDNGVPPDNREYELIMQYTAGGRITEKTQYAKTLLNNQSETIDNQYTYSYYSNQPHTLESIDGYNTQFTWDVNGNLIWAEKYRLLAWDEENRLAGVSDENEGIFCFYDANGERTLKLSTNSTFLTINGQEMKDIEVTNAVMYASPYWVVDEKCYSKHYYAGSDRVCSKIGGGISSYWYEDTLVGWENVYNKKKRQIEYLNRTAYKLGEYNPEFEFNGQGNPDIILNLELTKLDSLNTYEPECYFYHTDHIGSTSWITDINGGWIQYCEYLPFGEPLVDQRSTTWNSRYTFSGKERDGETGYSYFGARYYNSDISIWLSVDPLSDKYPNLSPYNYCANNPIILVDPDGRELVITGDDAADATQQLENQTSKKFNIVRHEDGTVSYEGKARTRADRYIKKVIDDENITVNIVAKNSTNFKAHDGTEYTYETDEEGNIGGGAYGGSTVSEDGQVNAYQYINPEKLGILDGKVGDKKTGGYMLHEVAEGYESGKIAYRKGTGDNVGGPRYNTAHQRANKISGGGWLILKYTRDRMDIKTGRVWQEVYKKEYIRSNN